MTDEELKEIQRKAAALRKELKLPSGKNTKVKSSDCGPQPVLLKFSDIQPEKLEWLWKNKIPMGKVTLLVGNPGTGKSFLTVHLAARVSTGTPWPDLPNDKIEAGSVIILTSEDDLADTVRIRLEAAGADLDRVKTIPAVKQNGKKQRSLFNLTNDLEVLVKAVVKTNDVRLIIIDPITAYMGGNNSNSNTEVREFLAPLAELAAKYGVAIVGISHLNKNTMVPAAYRTLGSIGFVAAARAVWLVAKDPDDNERRFLVPDKNNLTKKSTGLSFRLVDTKVKTDKGPADTAFCEFESGEIYKTADEVLQVESKNTKSPSCREEAIEWLKDILSSGPRLATEIYQEAEAQGIAKSTLGRAKRVAGVRSRRNGEDGRWTWSLPD